MAPSSTKVRGQTRSARSVLLTSSPPDCTSSATISNARPPRGTGTPDERNSRRARSISHPAEAYTDRWPCPGTIASPYLRNVTLGILLFCLVLFLAAMYEWGRGRDFRVIK